LHFWRFEISERRRIPEIVLDTNSAAYAERCDTAVRAPNAATAWTEAGLHWKMQSNRQVVLVRNKTQKKKITKGGYRF
tara:strand:- start:502 stop:735 length:234 start_codon:yes stop_codon:yes gene_type:complete